MLFRSLGEQLARTHLESHGYRVLTANYRSPYGEIDLIAEDRAQTQATLVFVEVKTRRSRLFGTPLQAVTPKKQERMWLTAQHWLMNHLKGEPEPSCRFDVIEVFVGSDGLSKVEHHVAVGVQSGE